MWTSGTGWYELNTGKQSYGKKPVTAHEMPPLWGFIFLNPTNWDSEAKEEDGKVCAFQTVTLLKPMVYL